LLTAIFDWRLFLVFTTVYTAAGNGYPHWAVLHYEATSIDSTYRNDCRGSRVYPKKAIKQTHDRPTFRAVRPMIVSNCVSPLVYLPGKHAIFRTMDMLL
jgi:hypothetical protein